VSAGFELTSAEEALRVLGRLAESDRRWILERLPAAARSQLSGVAENGAAGAPSDAVTRGAAAVNDGSDDAVERLSTASVGRLVEILHTEPDWLVHAVLAARDWRWRKEVLQRLPASLRLDVARMQRSGVTLAGPATNLLLRMLSAQIGAKHEATIPKFSFESLLARFSRRAGR
jgi:hypothetical protein